MLFKEDYQKLFKKWYDAAGGGFCDVYFAEEMCKIETIQTNIINFEKLKISARKKYEDELVAIDKKIQEIRTKCPHDYMKYFPDASGNNDSHHECVVCGYQE